MGVTLVTVVWIFLMSSVTLVTSSKESELIADLLKDYIKGDPPPNAPTEVRIGTYFNKLGEFDEAGEMTFSGNFYLRQNWKDSRLEFDPDKIDGKKSIRLSHSAVNDIWKPDTFFRNGYEIEHQKMFEDNTLMKLNASGFLWFVTQITTTFHCPMKFQKYPFDTQTCPIMFESFGYTMDNVYFTWLDRPVELDEAIEIASYTLTNKVLYDCSQNYTGGAFPCLEAKFVLQRDTGYFAIQVFIPTIILVMMSWFVFWLDANDVFQRMGLIFLLMVCLILMQTSMANQIAKVSYIKAIDVWMFMCQLFVLAVLIQSIIVKVILTRSYKPTEHLNMDEPGVKTLPDNKVTSRIDLVSRIAYPVLFLLFIIIYFGIYNTKSDS